MSARQLRAMLSEALIDAGPDAPTLCEGWRTRHLAAHLYLREHESLTMAGLLIPSRRPALDSLTIARGDEAADAGAYGRLVGRFAAGPGALSPWRLADNVANVLEYTVHLEDVVRAGDGPATSYSAQQLAEIWRHFRGRARMMFRGEPTRVALIAAPEDGGFRVAVGRRDNSLPLVVVRARLIDLVMLAFGRPAEIAVTGPDDAAAAFRSRDRQL